jgi:hypothetical protein
MDLQSLISKFGDEELFLYRAENNTYLYKDYFDEETLCFIEVVVLDCEEAMFHRETLNDLVGMVNVFGGHVGFNNEVIYSV